MPGLVCLTRSDVSADQWEKVRLHFPDSLDSVTWHSNMASGVFGRNLNLEV